MGFAHVGCLGRSLRSRRTVRLLLSRPWARAITIGLITIMVAVVALQSSSPAAAAVYTPPDLLNPNLLQGYTDSGGVYNATSAQFASIQNFEQQAISHVIQDHGLSSDDATAVQTWARADALAELWGLIAQAIQTAPASRTADQTNVVAWLTHVQQQENLLAAEDAGGEYVKWQGAGLSTSQYQSLLATNPSESTLQNYFSDSSFPSTGYCAYRSPAPFQSDYTGYDVQTCVTPPTSPGFLPQPPSYDDLVKWGGAVANPTVNSASYAGLSRDVAQGIEILSSLAGSAAIGVGIGTSAPLATALSGSAFQTAVFPFAARANQQVIDAAVKAATAAAEAAGESTSEAAAEASAEVAAEAAAVGGVMAAASAGLIVASVLANVAITVVEIINIVDALQLPNQLATAIVDARTATPDLAAMFNNSSQVSGLYGLFIAAALPSPRPESGDNTIASTISAALGPCLNAPEIFSANTQTDPQFAIQAQGSTDTTYANTLTWQDTSSGLTTTARLHETWFVGTVSADGLPSTTVESLRIHYTDWNGNEQTGWLYDDASGYHFQLVKTLDPSATPMNPATCIGDGTCASSPSINYIGADGKDYTAYVVAAQAPLIAPAVSSVPVVNVPVTLTANSSASAGLTVTDSWQFYFDNPAFITCPSGGYDCIDWGPAIDGSVIQHTFTSAGEWQVLLTATSNNGISTQSSFTIFVRYTSTDEPPTLALAPASTDPACTAGVTCDDRTGQTGNPISIDFNAAVHNATTEAVASVDWGDGTSTKPGSLGLDYFYDPPLTPPDGSQDWSLTHSYATPGQYTVSVSVSVDLNDGTSFTVSKSAVYTIQGAVALSWPAPVSITYGTPLDGIQPPPTASVPGTFSYTVDGKPANTNAVLLPGQHSLTIAFTPVDTTLYTTPQPVTSTFNVADAPLTITAKNQSMSYGGAVPDFTAGETGFVYPDTSSIVTGLTCGALDKQGNPVSSDTPVGSYQITCSGAAATNYTISYVAGSLTVGPVPLTISASDQTMIVGATPNPGWFGTGWKNGDGPDNLTVKPDCTTTATSSSPVGTYPINCSGAVDGNYTLSYQAGTLTISYGVALANNETSISVNQGYWALIELKVENAAGRNLSSRTLKVTAENLAPAGQSWDGKDGNFVYSFQYGGTGGYQLLINSRSLSAGSYTLSYEITGDPAIHTITIHVAG